VNGTKNEYLYNKKELQEELGTYDYGARFYDPLIVRFNTVDAYAEQYVAFSPYQYAGLNPIKNMDINGDSIKVSYQWTLDLTAFGAGTHTFTGTVYFEGSTAYNPDGTAYTGDNAFVGAVSSALGTLREGAEGRETVDNLEASTNVTTVYQRSANKTDETKGSYIFWNPNGSAGPPDQNSNTPTRPSYIGLGHELAHVEDIWHSSTFTGNWYSATDTHGDRVNVSNAEKYATYKENLYRAEHNLPLRTYYSPTEDGGVEQQSRIINRRGENMWIRTKPLPQPSQVKIIPPTTIPLRPIKL